MISIFLPISFSICNAFLISAILLAISSSDKVTPLLSATFLRLALISSSDGVNEPGASPVFTNKYLSWFFASESPTILSVWTSSTVADLGLRASI